MEQRENAIVSAAHDVFVEHGFEGARIADIAAAAAVAEGTIYLYFRNKHALLDAVVARFYAGLTDAAQAGALEFAETFDQLRFLAEHHLIHCIREWRILELAMSQYKSLQRYRVEGPYQLNKRYVAIFDGIVRKGVQRGEIDASLPHWMIRDLFYGALEYATRTLMIRGRKKDIAIVVDSLMAMLKNGIVAADRLPKSGFDLQQISGRLERVAERLEQAAG